MGMIDIRTVGSFPQRRKTFPAMKHGHASAVAEAIEWLSGPVMQEAIKQDHDLHADGERPEGQFGRPPK